jgi:two-component system LytT family sensor kinase
LRILKYALGLVVLWTIPALVFSLQFAFDGWGENSPNMLWQAILRGLPRWLVWAPLTPVAVRIARRIEANQRMRRPQQLLMHVLASIALAVLAALVWAAAPVMGQGKTTYWLMFLMLTPVSIVWSFPLYGAIAATTYALDARLAAERLEKQLTQARLEALQSQLRPHFFFNTLHSIASLIRAGRSPEAISMIARLGDLMRETLNEGAALTTLNRELEMVRLYLEIQKVRFPDRLQVQFETESKTLQAHVPSLLLQPIVENAIDHGIATLAEGGDIIIESKAEEDGLVLQVRNSGCLRPAFSEGIGLRNTKQRLNQLYGSRHQFAITNCGGHVTVRILIPW